MREKEQQSREPERLQVLCNMYVYLAIVGNWSIRGKKKRGVFKWARPSGGAKSLQ